MHNTDNYNSIEINSYDGGNIYYFCTDVWYSSVFCTGYFPLHHSTYISTSNSNFPHDALLILSQ